MQVDNESTVEDSEDEFFPEDDQEDRQSVDNEEEDEEVMSLFICLQTTFTDSFFFRRQKIATSWRRK